MSKTVNFIEAVNSGKRFRIVNTNNGFIGNWYFIKEGYAHSENHGKLSIELNFLQEQYELEEKTITITESQFDEALKNFFKDAPFPCQTKLKKELGF